MDSMWSKHILMVAILTSAGPSFVYHRGITVSGQTCGEMSLVSSPLKANLSSPNFGSYEPNLNCSWTISASPGLAVELIITSFMLQNSSSCLADSLTIYDGASTFAVILFGPECGSSIQWPLYRTPIVSTGSALTILFTTDDSINEAGFHITYQEVSKREEFFLVSSISNGAIYKLNKLGKNYETVVTGLSELTAVDFDPVERKVYFPVGGNRTINRVNIDGSNHEIIVSGGIFYTCCIAVDHFSRFLYWIDSLGQTISRSSLDGSNRTTLFSNIRSLRSIAISRELGYLFWSSLTPLRIERSRVDGTEREVIISTGLSIPLSLDIYENKLYWADTSLDKIERSEFDGSQRELVMQFQEDVSPRGLVVLKNAIFWSDYDTGRVHVLDRDFKRNGISPQFDDVTYRLWGLAFYSGNKTDYECVTNPCVNGVCIDGIGSPFCDCTGTAFEGALCDVDPNECVPNPCVNGVCIYGNNSSICDCTGTGFEGALCDMVQSTPDSLMCPKSMSITPSQGRISSEVPYVTPNCTNDEGLVFDAICLPASGRTFAVGVSEVGCVCFDKGQQIDKCVFTVTVLDLSKNQYTTWIALSAVLFFMLLLFGTGTIIYCRKCRIEESVRPPKNIPMTNQSPSSTQPALTLAYEEPDNSFSSPDSKEVPEYERTLPLTASESQPEHTYLEPNEDSPYYISAVP